MYGIARGAELEERPVDSRHLGLGASIGSRGGTAVEDRCDRW